MTPHQVTRRRDGTYSREWQCCCGWASDADQPGAAMAAIRHQAAGSRPAGAAPDGAQGAAPTPEEDYANAAAECAQPVTSNASRISMISLSDFFTVPPLGFVSCVVRDLETSPGGTLRFGPTRRADPPAQREISCPQKGK